MNKEDTTNILFVGRLIEQKNPLFAIKVFAEYKKINESAILTIIGEGTLKNECDTLIHNLGISESIRSVEQTDKMPFFYQEADILLLPSIYEGLPLTLVEAQACGTKCVVSDTVTREIDLGLIQYMSLEQNEEKWAEVLSALRNTKKEINQEKLQRFSSINTANVVYEAYGLK